MDSAKKLVLWQEALPGYVVTRPFFFVVLPSCPLAPGDQEQSAAETRREVFEELEQFSVSRQVSVVPPMLSLFRPMLSPGHPTPFSVERVVVRQLNLVFRTSKPAQRESVTIEQEFFSYHRWNRSCLVVTEQIGEGFDVKPKLTFLRRRRGCRFNCHYFDGITPGTLDVGKNCQHRQTNHNHCH